MKTDIRQNGLDSWLSPSWQSLSLIPLPLTGELGSECKMMELTQRKRTFPVQLPLTFLLAQGHVPPFSVPEPPPWLGERARPSLAPRPSQHAPPGQPWPPAGPLGFWLPAVVPGSFQPPTPPAD